MESRYWIIGFIIIVLFVSYCGVLWCGILWCFMFYYNFYFFYSICFFENCFIIFILFIIIYLFDILNYILYLYSDNLSIRINFILRQLQDKKIIPLAGYLLLFSFLLCRYLSAYFHLSLLRCFPLLSCHPMQSGNFSSVSQFLFSLQCLSLPRYALW